MSTSTVDELVTLAMREHDAVCHDGPHRGGHWYATFESDTGAAEGFRRAVAARWGSGLTSIQEAGAWSVVCVRTDGAA